MTERAMYERDGSCFVATSLTRGGWDPRHINGATLLALLGHCLDDVPTLTPMWLARITVDLARPVPVGKRLEVLSEVAREGKKLQVVQQNLVVDGAEHTRSTALRLRTEDLSDIAELPSAGAIERPADLLTAPDDSPSMRTENAPDAGFHEAVEIRRAQFKEGDGSGYWVRRKVPVVAGASVGPAARVTFAFDCASMVGITRDKGRMTAINPDVSAHLLRPPVDGWIGITGLTRFESRIGRSVSDAQFSDSDGVFAVGSVSQLLQRQN